MFDSTLFINGEHLHQLTKIHMYSNCARILYNHIDKKQQLRKKGESYDRHCYIEVLRTSTTVVQV